VLFRYGTQYTLHESLWRCLRPMVSGLVYGVGIARGTHFVTELAAVARGVQVFGLQMADHPLAGETPVAALPAAQPPAFQLANHRIHEFLSHYKEQCPLP
jgi:hypothetical protein